MTVINMADHTGDAMRWTVEQALEDALKEVREGVKTHPKVVIIFVDDKEDKFRYNFTQAGFHMSEIVAALAIVSHSIMHNEME